MTSSSGQETVDQVLAVADSIPAASEALVAFLVGQGLPLPSLYLERGGRLRCMTHGYWQVHDGFPPGVGVIGATYARGEVTQTAPAESPDYIAASADVESEICVPILRSGRPIGALNVEAPGPLPPDTAEILRNCAAAFVTRLEQLDGIPPELPSPRLARRATRLSELMAIAQRLCDGAAAACRATVSIGVAIGNPDEADTHVLQRADAALYAAKDAGRADVRLAAPGQA